MMLSPSCSSTTLSADSVDSDAAMELDSCYSPTSIPESEQVEAFILPDEYTCVGTRDTLSPSMKAASNPDPQVLKAVLSQGKELHNKQVIEELKRRKEEGISLFPSYEHSVGYFDFPFADMSPDFGPNIVRYNAQAVGITSPLMEAIRAQLPKNVKTLLDAGANPNGVPLGVMEEYSAFFLRFRPEIPPRADEKGDVASRDVLLQCMDLAQISPLTREEVEDRKEDAMSPFWCEERFIPKDYYRHGDNLTSLVEAAGTESIEIFDMLLAAGADASYWMRPHFYLPLLPSSSSLSVSSPIHAAIRCGKTEMLQHLLKLSFDSNTMPLVNPTRCFTPLVSTFVHIEHFNKEAFDILACQPSINFEIRTPVYDVHLLHFAVARHDIDMLKHVVSKVPLKNAGVTALGHTLLHIVCLPANSLEVQRYSSQIAACIHETRDLHTTPDPHVEFQNDEVHWPWYNPFQVHYFRAQNQVIKFLWENGIRDIEKLDVHGNTALHYLAGYRHVSLGILEWLFEQDDSIEILWNQGNGMDSLSPADLAAAGFRAERDNPKEWKDWFRREWMEERVINKQYIWEDLLGSKAKRSLF